MTAIERVARTQRLLGATVIARAIAWGLAATFAILAIVSFAALASQSLASREQSLIAIALASGLLVAGTLIWRSRHFASRHRVALWIEEHDPSLEYALVTAVESGRLELQGDRLLRDWTATARQRASCTSDKP